MNRFGSNPGHENRLHMMETCIRPPLEARQEGEFLPRISRLSAAGAQFFGGGTHRTQWRVVTISAS
jgi:hypothetical protein